MISLDRTKLTHHGILGQRWGVRRYQNTDGSLTEAGKKRYYVAGTAYRRMRADEETQKRMSEFRNNMYRSLGGTKSLNLQKMSTFDYVPDADEDVVVKKGSDVRHITVNKNTKLKSHHMFVSTNDTDHKNYAGLYAAFRSTRKEYGDRLSQLRFLPFSYFCLLLLLPLILQYLLRQ